MNNMNGIGQARYHLLELEEMGEKMSPPELHAKQLILRNLINSLSEQPCLTDADKKNLHEIKSHLDTLHNPSIVDKIHDAFSSVMSYFSEPQSHKLTAQQISNKIPEGIVQNKLLTPLQIDRYVAFAGNTDKSLNNACESVLKESIRFASFTLSQSVGRYGIRSRGNINNPVPTLTTMLKDPRCCLEYLDFSYSEMTVDELIQILNAIPENSKLKYIYFGPQNRSQVYQTDDAFKKLTSFLKETTSPVLVLGLCELRLLAAPESMLRLAEVDASNPIKQTLVNYHNARAPNIPFDATPHLLKLQTTFYGSTYH